MMTEICGATCRMMMELGGATCRMMMEVGGATKSTLSKVSRNLIMSVVIDVRRYIS